VTRPPTAAGPAPDVTLCIPAWQAADFIDRTLRCARDQTYGALRILVSVDRCEDGTEEICRRHAREDRRVEVHAHRERLGWARNANFLLDRSGTEFAGIYFHDDVIDRTYVERLVAALRERPDAASAHCDVAHFGGGERPAAGHAYEGPAWQRLLAHLVVEQKGALERSMLRAELTEGLVRVSTGPLAGAFAQHPFMMRMVAAGPALRVPEALYRRWASRRGGLTDGWLSLPFEEILEGHRATAEDGVRIIDGLDPAPEERATLLFGLFVFMTGRLRRAEIRHDAPSLHPADRLAPELAGVSMPPAVGRLPSPLRDWCEEAYERVLWQTARRGLGVGDHEQAASALELLTRRLPADPRPWARLSDALRGAGRADEADAARRRARELRHARDHRGARA
jgi:hypothetical protein